MTKQPSSCGWLLMLALAASVTPAFAQGAATARPSCGDAPSFKSLFTDTIGDVRHVGSRNSVELLALGSVAAIGAHAVDGRVSGAFTDSPRLRETFESGAFIGGTPFELSASIGAYAIGRALHKPCAASLGADLFRAQLLAEGFTMAIKEATRRSRPDGSGYSFPSGHTTVAFASATVLQQHFGWKIGIPAYAAASYVAASRVQMRRHYVSDVAFGAALGVIAGRTVTVGHRHRLMVTPMMTPGGAGAGFTLLGN